LSDNLEEKKSPPKGEKTGLAEVGTCPGGYGRSYQKPEGAAKVWT